MSQELYLNTELPALEANSVCVYLHVNPESQEIFYVGIGVKHRPFATKNSRSDEWNEYVQSIYFNYNVIIIEENLSYAESGIIEKRLIKQIGRKDKGLGTLLNKTDGGESSSYSNTMALCQKINILEQYVEKLFVIENEIIQKVLQCDTKIEFQQKFKEDYDLAVKLDLLDKVCEYMEKSKEKFIVEQDKKFKELMDKVKFFNDRILKITKFQLKHEKMVKKLIVESEKNIVTDEDEITSSDLKLETDESSKFFVFNNVKKYLIQYEKTTGIIL